MPILFGQIDGEINISLHGALRKSAGKKMAVSIWKQRGGCENLC